MDDSAGAILLLLIIGLVWLIPLLNILFSRKTTGSEKLAWILAVIFISWFAWIFYLLLAPIKKKSRYHWSLISPFRECNASSIVRIMHIFYRSIYYETDLQQLVNEKKSMNMHRAWSCCTPWSSRLPSRKGRATRHSFFWIQHWGNGSIHVY